MNGRFQNTEGECAGVKLKMDLKREVRGRHVLVVEDVVDMGFTME